MRFTLRRSTAVVGGIAIICFCSCERHRVGELPSEPSPKHSHQVPAEPEVTPPARNAPASFFPSPTKP